MTTDGTLDAERWHDYVLEHGCALTQFWETHLSDCDRNILYVLGKGFDPRMCLGIETLLSAGGAGKRDVLAIDFDEGSASPSRRHAPEVAGNWAKLQGLIGHRGSVQTQIVKMWSSDGRRIGSRSAVGVFSNASQLTGYTDIVIDISAMPRTVYFPLVGKTLHLLDTYPFQRPYPNLHIMVSENPSLDSHIRDEGVDDVAGYIHSFEGGLGMEATAQVPRVWIPLLGEGQGMQLERVYDLVGPDEICPVLPSPSLNPRRGDDLVLEYRELLFDRLRIDPRNFIYASERNPFEVYRQVRSTVLHYRHALQPLGGCKSVISSLSSKLMSVGALLVAYELKEKGVNVGVAHVEAQGYVMDAAAVSSSAQTESELFGLWIYGECYGA